MRLRLPSQGKAFLTILVIAMLGVGLACAGEKATPTSSPTATLAPTATTAPTATLVPTATATLVPGEPTPTATAVPTVTATAAPTATPRVTAATLTQLPGYKAEWGEPQRGGIMKLGLPQAPTTNRPPSGCNAAIYGPVCASNYNQLLRYDPWVGMGSLVGDLAKSWEFSGDGLTLTLKLEEGVRFYDNPVVPADIRGGEFTCEDVQATMEYDLNPPEPKSSPNSNLLHITGVTCPDGPLGYTAVITFNRVLAKTLGMLTKDVNMLDKEWIPWYVANHFDELGMSTDASLQLVTGTGPMKTVEYQVDIIARLRRNPDYWREGLPLLDGLDVHILKDHTTRFAALATGQIHWFGAGSSSLLPGQIVQVERDFKDRIELVYQAYTFTIGAYFNMNRAPYNDRRVRQAINLAIDRDEWLLFKQAGSRPTSILMGSLGTYPTFWWGTPEEELRTWPGIRQPKDQDIAEANRLLDEVFGKGKRFNTTCVTRNMQNYVDYCLFFADQMKTKLGIGVTSMPMEQAVLNVLTEVCNLDMSGNMLNSTVGDPDSELFKYSYAYPKSTYCAIDGMKAAEPVVQAELEAMIAAQTGELDQAKRREMLLAIEKKLYFEMIYQVHYGWLILYYGITPDVKGYTLPGFVTFTYSIFERTWLAK